MSILARSVGNAFRNKVRSGAVVIILAVAIGLALSMLVANQAVADKITSLKASMGNNLTVNPAGSRGGQGGGEPLTTADLSTASSVAHISSVAGTLSLRLGNASTTAPAPTAPEGHGGSRIGRALSGTTSLVSAVDPGTLGNWENDQTSTSAATASSGAAGAGSTAVRPAFSIPIEATGVSGSVNAAAEPINIINGTVLNDFAATSAQALVGSTLATKNSLTVGSAFTVNNRTMTVSGIFDAGTAFDNNAIYLPLTAAQTLASQPGEISTMTVLVDSIDNVNATKTVLASALGSTRVDVTAGSGRLDSAIGSLGSVQRISLIGFIAAVGTAGLIVLLIMTMVVRERRREIGVLKAIGASNRSIGVQFVFEALVLLVMGSVVGAMLASVSGNSIVGALVSGNTGTTAAAAGSGRQGLLAARQAAGGFGGTAAPGGGRGAFAGSSQLIGTVSTSLGWQGLVLGVLGILLIAALGALIPALLTAKVRPIEVLRGE